MEGLLGGDSWSGSVSLPKLRITWKLSTVAGLQPELVSKQLIDINGLVDDSNVITVATGSCDYATKIASVTWNGIQLDGVTVDAPEWGSPEMVTVGKLSGKNEYGEKTQNITINAISLMNWSEAGYFTDDAKVELKINFENAAALGLDPISVFIMDSQNGIVD